MLLHTRSKQKAFGGALHDTVYSGTQENRRRFSAGVYSARDTGFLRASGLRRVVYPRSTVHPIGPVAVHPG